jgi:hypothetical protein
MKLILLLVFVIFFNSIRETESEWSLEFSDDFDGEQLESRNWYSEEELSEFRKFFS